MLQVDQYVNTSIICIHIGFFVCVHLIHLQKVKQIEHATTESMLRCLVSSSLSQQASLGHLSSTALRWEPVRLFIAVAQVGVSQDVSSAFLLQPAALGASLHPKSLWNDVSPCLSLSLSSGHGEFGAILNTFVTLQHASANIVIGLMALSAAVI